MKGIIFLYYYTNRLMLGSSIVLTIPNHDIRAGVNVVQGLARWLIGRRSIHHGFGYDQIKGLIETDTMEISVK